MGKVKKLRQKYHLTVQKSKPLSSLAEVQEENNPNGPKNKEQNLLSKENVFADIEISWDDINKSLSKDFDVRSIVSCKSRKELKEEERHLKKKEKRKLRHERFIQKLDVTHRLTHNSKSKKKTKNKIKDVGGNMTSLFDALPLLPSTGESNTKKKFEYTKAKPKGILKAKQRLMKQVFDIHLFKRIIDDEIFIQNPLEAITEHVKKKVSAQN